MTTARYVFDFSEGDKDQKDLLGGQGREPGGDGEAGAARAAGVHDLHRGVPGVPGLGCGARGAGRGDRRALAALEAARGKKLGDPDDPLLVSVRSGAKFSMPGMMETVLNIGLNDDSVHGLAAQADNPRFAWDSYRRLIQMFGKTVQHIERRAVRARARRAQGTQGRHR